MSDMKSGWFIGDFEPSILRTKDFEVCYKVHPKDSPWPAHYHKIATEYNLLVRGRLRLNDTIVESGTIFVLEPGEIAAPVFLEDCEVIVVKVPSALGDKYEV